MGLVRVGVTRDTMGGSRGHWLKKEEEKKKKKNYYEGLFLMLQQSLLEGRGHTRSAVPS